MMFAFGILGKLLNDILNNLFLCVRLSFSFAAPFSLLPLSSFPGLHGNPISSTQTKQKQKRNSMYCTLQVIQASLL